MVLASYIRRKLTERDVQKERQAWQAWLAKREKFEKENPGKEFNEPPLAAANRRQAPERPRTGTRPGPFHSPLARATASTYGSRPILTAHIFSRPISVLTAHIFSRPTSSHGPHLSLRPTSVITAHIFSRPTSVITAHICHYGPHLSFRAEREIQSAWSTARPRRQGLSCLRQAGNPSLCSG